MPAGPAKPGASPSPGRPGVGPQLTGGPLLPPLGRADSCGDARGLQAPSAPATPEDGKRAQVVEPMVHMGAPASHSRPGPLRARPPDPRPGAHRRGSTGTLRGPPPGPPPRRGPRPGPPPREDPRPGSPPRGRIPAPVLRLGRAPASAPGGPLAGPRRPPSP